MPTTRQPLIFAIWPTTVPTAPVLFIFDVEHGDRFAQRAASAGVLGLISLVAFCSVYVATGRLGFVGATLAGWAAFGLSTIVLTHVDPPLAGRGLMTLAAIGTAAWLLARRSSASDAPRPTGDLLPWRLAITAAMVLALTAAADGLSPKVAGLIAPFPIITTVLAAFTHARAGLDAAVELLSGLVPALVCFLTFTFTIAATLERLGTAGGFGLATAATLSLWSALVVRSQSAPSR